jgi:predicted nucleic acid-binding protein
VNGLFEKILTGVCMGKTSAVVIADAGPIIHLDELACIDILLDFGKVIVPETVWLEVQHHRPQVLESANTLLIRQRARQFSPMVNALAPLYTLHTGEQEALHLCLEFENSLLLTDDTAARLAAKSLGLSAHGTLGLLVRAIRQQSRSKAEVLELLQAIPTLTSLHIRPSLLAEIIKDVEINAK